MKKRLYKPFLKNCKFIYGVKVNSFKALGEVAKKP
jgi:hypothetical protein